MGTYFVNSLNLIICIYLLSLHYNLQSSYTFIICDNLCSKLVILYIDSNRNFIKSNSNKLNEPTFRRRVLSNQETPSSTVYDELDEQLDDSKISFDESITHSSDCLLPTNNLAGTTEELNVPLTSTPVIKVKSLEQPQVKRVNEKFSYESEKTNFDEGSNLNSNIRNASDFEGYNEGVTFTSIRKYEVVDTTTLKRVKITKNSSSMCRNCCVLQFAVLKDLVLSILRLGFSLTFILNPYFSTIILDFMVPFVPFIPFDLFQLAFLIFISNLIKFTRNLFKLYNFIKYLISNFNFIFNFIIDNKFSLLLILLVLLVLLILVLLFIYFYS